jgi:transposase
VIKAYKYRVKDRRVAKRLTAHAYACNQVWNWCVAQHEDTLARHRAGGPKRKWLSAFDLAKQCAGVGKDLGIHQQTVQSVCDQFATSRAHRPHLRFRSSFGKKRARGWVPFQRQSRRITDDAVTYLGQTYRVFGAKRRQIPEAAGGGSFVEDGRGRWWLVLRVEAPDPIAANDGAVGIDLGLKDFAALSTGEKIAAPRYFRQLEVKLAAAQRARNRRRAAAISAKIANTRRDFHHKLSTRLSRDYAFIAVGGVSAKALARTRMAKSVHDAGWSTFRQMLRYKSPGYREVDEAFTTQTCSSCGSLPPERPRGIAGLGIREWSCSACGETHDRDVNAALNILALGRSAAPRADESRRVA